MEHDIQRSLTIPRPFDIALAAIALGRGAFTTVSSGPESIAGTWLESVRTLFVGKNGALSGHAWNERNWDPRPMFFARRSTLIHQRAVIITAGFWMKDLSVGKTTLLRLVRSGK